MALIDGMVSISALDASERNIGLIVKNTSGQFARSTTPSEQLPFEVKNVQIQEDSFLTLTMRADAAATLNAATSVINIPVTQYVMAGGRGSTPTQPAEIMLTKEDFGLSANIPLPALTQLEIGRYKVPAGTMIKPGWGAYSALDAAKGRVYIDLES